MSINPPSAPASVDDLSRRSFVFTFLAPLARLHTAPRQHPEGTAGGLFQKQQNPAIRSAGTICDSRSRAPLALPSTPIPMFIIRRLNALIPVNILHEIPA
jgi:hypothetical protein